MHVMKNCLDYFILVFYLHIICVISHTIWRNIDESLILIKRCSSCVCW